MRRSVSSETGWPDPARQVSSGAVVVVMSLPVSQNHGCAVGPDERPPPGIPQPCGAGRREPGRPT